MKTQILQLVQHSTHGTCRLSSDDLLNMPIPIPPLAEQRVSLCDRLEAQLASAQTESRRLLDALLDEALAPAT